MKVYSDNIVIGFRSAIEFANFWHDEALKVIYPPEQILTNFAITKIPTIFTCLFTKCVKFQLYPFERHEIINNTCCCSVRPYSGFPKKLWNGFEFICF